MTSDSAGKPEVRARLRGAGIHPTSQRVEVAHSLLSQNAHLSAEDVAREVNREYPMVSRATVYNSLALFVTHGLIREVVVEPGKMLYDPNVSHHHHLYYVDSKELVDVPADEVQVQALSQLPPGTVLQQVDVVVRVFRQAIPAPQARGDAAVPLTTKPVAEFVPTGK